MPNPLPRQTHDDDIPRFERWLGVTVSSLVPAVIGLYVPRFLIPSIVATFALFVTGLVMLRRQTVRRRLEQGKHTPATQYELEAS